MGKLPESLRIGMIRASDSHDEWNLSEFLEALKKELEIRESHAPLFRANFAPGQGGKDQVSMARPNNKQSNNQLKSASALHSNVKEKRCAFCLGKHEEIACGTVKNKEERKNIVRKFGRCYVCLKKGHRSFECRSGLVCTVCNEKHHISLCDKDKIAPANKEVLPSAPVAPISTNANSCVESVECGGRVALQTAQAFVQGKRNVRVRVLFDSGSHKSFVTSNVVSNANISPFKQESLSICRFGDKEAIVSSNDVVMLNLMPAGGGQGVSINAYVVDSISEVRNEHLEIVKREYDHLRDL